MTFEIRRLSSNVSALVGPNFSGRTAELERWTQRARGILVKESTSSAISGLQDTVASELRFYCKSNQARFANATEIAGQLGLREIWDQNPFAGECSGGQEAALAILCRLVLDRPALGLDVCVEQLSLDLRRHLYDSVLPLFPLTNISVADNRLDEALPDQAHRNHLSGPIPEVISNSTSSDPPRNLSLNRITFAYKDGHPVLSGFSAEFAPGIHHLRGRNGAGKSTVAKLLAGLLRADAGQIEIGGKRMEPYREPGKFAAYAFQNPSLQLFAATVPAPHDMSLFNAFGLQECVGLHPLDLPWVLRKRLSIALTLARTTPTVVLDEPTLGQDAEFCRLLASILQAIATTGRIIIVISHSTRFVKMLDATDVPLEELTPFQ